MGWPTTRAPLVMDLLPSAISSSATRILRGKRPLLPIIVGIAVVSLLALLLGASVIARRAAADAAPANASTTELVPPSTVIVAPPPVDPLPSASADEHATPQPEKKSSEGEPSTE
jgi:hypothetical protein